MKNVVQIFGVHQAYWVVVQRSARIWSVETMWEVITACVVIQHDCAG
jgi:hypothetical protein